MPVGEISSFLLADDAFVFKIGLVAAENYVWVIAVRVSLCKDMGIRKDIIFIQLYIQIGCMNAQIKLSLRTTFDVRIFHACSVRTKILMN